jgi:hypothetical protein
MEDSKLAGKWGDEEEENLALVSKTRKGKRKGSKGNSEESISHPSKN